MFSSAASRQLFDEKEKKASEFNRILKGLIILYVNMHPDDDKIDRLKTRVFTGCQIDHHGLITMVGPYLLKYEDKIYNREEDFFKSNINEISQAEMSALNKSATAASTATYLIELIKKDYSNMNKEEQDDIYERVVEMLNTYIDYVALEFKK